VDSRPISVPDRIGEFVPFDHVELTKSARAASNATRIQSWNEQSAESLSRSYGSDSVHTVNCLCTGDALTVESRPIGEARAVGRHPQVWEGSGA
jgi:hypothetical protein